MRHDTDLILIERGGYRARLACGRRDVEAAQAFRHMAFHGVPGLDADRFDDLCDHVVVEDLNGRTACVFRFMQLADGRKIDRSYSAQYYDLSALAGFEGPMLELGRFCTLPGRHDPAVLRVAWAALTRFVDDNGVRMLFGCSSFAGTDAGPYGEAFAHLAQNHQAPHRWKPRLKAPEVVKYAARRGQARPDVRRAMRAMPPLLRSYLAMGGWVSDHAVVDPQMGTLHVFTGVEIGRVPRARAARLRAVAG